MSKKNEYKKMSEKDLNSILRLARKSLSKINKAIHFNINYGKQDNFGKLQTKKDELMNTIFNIEQILSGKEEKVLPLKKTGKV